MAELDHDILDIIDSIYSSSQDAGGWPSLTEKVGAALGAAEVKFKILGESQLRALAPDSKDLRKLPRKGPSEVEGPANIEAIGNPWHRYLIAGEPGRAYRCAEHPLPEQLRSSAYFDQCKQNLGLGDVFFLGAVWLREDNCYGLLSVLRSTPFDSSDVELIDRLIPHFCRSQQVQSCLDDASMLGDFAFDALDKLSTGVLLLNSSGRVIKSNRRARLTLENSVLNIVNDRLCLAQEQKNHELNLLVNNAIDMTNAGATLDDGSIGHIFKVDDEQSEKQLFLILAPASQQSVLMDSAKGRPLGLIVFVLDSSSESDVCSDCIRVAFDLTKKEVTVLQRILMHASPADISAELKVTVDAVRYHIKNIYHKTNTRRQAELVSLVERTIGKIASS